MDKGEKVLLITGVLVLGIGLGWFAHADYMENKVAPVPAVAKKPELKPTSTPTPKENWKTEI